MAKAPAKPEAEDEAAAPKGGGKKMMVIVLALVVLLVVAVGALGFMLLSKKKHGEGEADPAHDGEAAKPKVTVDASKPPTFVPLDAFTVNLVAENGEHFLQAVLVLKMADPKSGEAIKVFMPEIRHRTNLILSSKRPSELSTMEGREDLADEIMEETNDVLGYPPPPKRSKRKSAEPEGPVLAVLFNSFIIQ